MILGQLENSQDHCKRPAKWGDPVAHPIAFTIQFHGQTMPSDGLIVQNNYILLCRFEKLAGIPNAHLPAGMKHKPSSTQVLNL